MNTDKPTPKQIHILRHSLGLDDTGRGREYRNHFATDPGTTDWPDIEALIAAGLMEDRGEVAMWGGLHGIIVTEAGKRIARQQDPRPKVSRSRRRYLRFLEADSGLSFGEWLKQDSHPCSSVSIRG